MDPIESPVTNPLKSTDATLEFDEVQGVIASGIPEPTSWEVLPLQKVKDPETVGKGLTIMVKVVDVAH